jgi:hypothetical protein
MRATAKPRHILVIATGLIMLIFACLLATDAVSFDELFILTMP